MNEITEFDNMQCPKCGQKRGSYKIIENLKEENRQLKDQLRKYELDIEARGEVLETEVENVECFTAVELPTEDVILVNNEVCEKINETEVEVADTQVEVETETEVAEVAEVAEVETAEENSEESVDLTLSDEVIENVSEDIVAPTEITEGTVNEETTSEIISDEKTKTTEETTTEEITEIL